MQSYFTRSLLPLLIFLSVLSLHTTLAQNPDIMPRDFTLLDSVSRSKTYEGDLKLLVSELTKQCTSETEKARAVFIWVTDNIAYDYEAINKDKRPKPFECNGKNCTDKYAKWEEKLLNDVLKTKRAICSGFATLFKKMCDYAGLRTDIVPGCIKNKDIHIGKMGTLDHALYK